MSKIIRIPYTSLPEFNIITENYQIRYRLKSDDGNKTSAWSPIYSINPEFVYIQGDFEEPGHLIMQKHTGYVTSSWDSVSIYRDSILLGRLANYDLWAQYAENAGANPSEWIYKERVSTTSLNENIPATYIDSNGISRTPKWLRIEIYRPGRPVARYSDLSISITQDGTTVNTTNNTIVTASAHGLETGDAIVYTASSAIGGLTTDTAYWVRFISNTTFSLFNHKSEAISNTNIIDLTSTGSGTGTFDRYPFLLYKNKVTTL